MQELPKRPGLARTSPIRRNRHTLEQIILKLGAAEQLVNFGQSVADVSLALEVSAPRDHPWQQLYSGITSTEAKHLKELE